MPRSATDAAWLTAYHAAALAATVLASPLVALAHVVRGGSLAGLGQRYGGVPRVAGRPAWIHAASVGEVRAAEPLVRALHAGHPDVPLVLSVTTSSGLTAAARLTPLLAAPPFHPPLDALPWVALALARLRPRSLLVLETEIWPALLRAARARGIATALVNGRISAGSYPRHAAVKGLVRLALAGTRVLAMQSEEDARRIVALGADPATVSVTGNLKYDAAAAVATEPELPWARGAGLADGRWVTFASTAEGEEPMVLDAFASNVRTTPGLRALLAPRRPERWDDVAALVAARGLPLVRRTAMPPHAPVPPGGVLLLDTVGELARLYRHSELVFVGGSLVPRGGQNLMEPAAAGVPVLFGPHVSNFRDAEQALLDAGGGVAVASGELGPRIAALLGDEALRLRLGAAARQAVTRNEGATQRTLALIEPVLRRPTEGAA